MRKLLLFACLLLTTLAHAQTTWYVSPTGSDANTGTSADQPWKTIQEAVTKMASGDILIAAAGNYINSSATTPTEFWNLKVGNIGGGVVINKTITIKGAGADATIFGKVGGTGNISGSNNGGQLFEVQNGGSLTLEDLTLQDAGYDSNGGGAPTRGGAIMVAANAAATTIGTGNLTLRRCNLLRNSAKIAGAIAFISSGTFIMEGCYLDANKQFGGANTLGCAGIEIKGGNTVITNSIFIDHNAQVSTAGTTLGSVIHASEGTISLIHNTFARTIMNASQTSTATIRIIGTAQADKILNNLFYDNTFLDFWAGSTTANYTSSAVVKGNVLMAHTNLLNATTDNNVSSANTGASAAIAANFTKTVAPRTKVTFITNEGTAVIGKGATDASVPAKDIQGVNRNTAAPAVGATDLNPNARPTVSITSPTDNSTFAVGASVTLKATAEDTDGSITKVEFFHGSTSLGTAQLVNGSYELTLTNVTAGTYTLTAVATDNLLAVTTSTAITYVVKAANIPPVVSIVDPANEKLLIGPIESVILMANATDSDGIVTKVEFFNGTTKLGDGTLDGGVYTYTWMNPDFGTYSLTAKASDNEGSTTTSSVVTLFIKDAITSTEAELRKAGLLVVPTTDYAGFAISSARKPIAAVRAFDRQGRLVTNLHPAAMKVATIGADWNPGLYVLHIQLSSGETLVKKVVK